VHSNAVSMQASRDVNINISYAGEVRPKTVTMTGCQGDRRVETGRKLSRSAGKNVNEIILNTA
jgi:hypothetical protein